MSGNLIESIVADGRAFMASNISRGAVAPAYLEVPYTENDTAIVATSFDENGDWTAHNVTQINQEGRVVATDDDDDVTNTVLNGFGVFNYQRKQNVTISWQDAKDDVEHERIRKLLEEANSMDSFVMLDKNHEKACDDPLNEEQTARKYVAQTRVNLIDLFIEVGI